MELLKSIVHETLGEGAVFKNSQLVGGGCIHHAAKIITSEGDYFVKWSRNDQLMFKAEMDGLKLLREHSALRIPKPYNYGTIGGNSYLLMDNIQAGLISRTFWPNFAKGLASLHKVHSEVYGLETDNFIGSLPQINKKADNWIDFFINSRLEPQIERARNSGKMDEMASQKFDKLFSVLESLVPYEPASLLHGDLWSGNFLIDSSGEPSIIDPAVYYGHREMELSFTQLFGGFSPEFYEVYQKEYPLQPGFEDRVEIHNLYPLLVHVNLFGSSYLSGIIATLNRFT